MPINTNYTGDAGLGLGASAAVPVSTPDNLKVINETSRDIMLLDSDRNMKIFQQKVKDRDNLTDLILKDQVSTGDILPEYLPAFNSAKSKVESAYDEWKGNPNDTKGFKKYQDSVTNLQDIAASGQTNTKMLKQLEIEKSKQPLRSKQEDMQKHIDDQLQLTKKDIHNPVTPYQQLHDLNMGTFDSYVVPTSGYGGSFEGNATSTTPNTTQKTTTTSKTGNTKTTSTSTQKGGLPKGETPVTVVDGKPQLVTTTPDTVIDYNDILKRANNDFIAGEEGYEDQQQLLNKFENLDPTDPQRSLLKKNIDAINGQISKYNQDRNLTGVNAVTPVKAVDLGNGKYKINESAPSFAAKFALAKQGQFVQKGQPLFNKDVADYMIKKGKLAYDWAKLNKVDIPKAWAYMDKWKTQKDKLTEDENVANQKYTDLVGKIDTTGQTTRINTDDVPISRQFIGGITYDANGKKMLGRVYPNMRLYKEGEGFKTPDQVTVGKQDLSYSTYAASGKALLAKMTYPEWVRQHAESAGYKTESYYDTKFYNKNGSQIKSPQDLPDDLSKAFQKAQKNYGINFNQFLKGLGNLGNVLVEFHGAGGGVATPQTILEGSRFEQSQYGKKGFEGVYSDEGGGENTNTEQSSDDE